ncbi:UNVERIFIED_CONTAM: hypothetical protein Sradi_3198000 [Sesamum radiatum]|uniref:Uncharacterized protein n=1 Tax=Sesamum radiatum TaxID=300843 RepID=A0AAW2RG67_SESRA
MEKFILVALSFVISFSLQFHGFLLIFSTYSSGDTPYEQVKLYMIRLLFMVLHIVSAISYFYGKWRGWGRYVWRGFLILVHNGGAQHLGGVAAQLLPPLLGNIDSPSPQLCAAIIFSAMCLIGTYCRDDERVMVLGEFALQLGSTVGGLLLMGRN